MSHLRNLNFRMIQPAASRRCGTRASAVIGVLGMLCAAVIPVWAMTVVPVQAQGMGRQAASAALSSALIRLNQNPRDSEALIAAGNAALAMGDTDAAVGFFTRADVLSPNNSRIEAGLAGAKVHAEDPFSAIPLFIAAEKSGSIPPDMLADRGLAYDLIGDNVNAQQYYRQALATGPATNVNAEISRRLALSLAIGGDRRASETVLSSLLLKQDRAAWRARIFALAILGYEDEAVATAKSTLPPEMALQIAPYLRYMRRLTPSQQAAAANLGHFPQAAEIGQDDPRVAQYAHTLDRSGVGGVDRRLVPEGAPLVGVANTASPNDKLTRKRRRDQHVDTSVVALVRNAIAPARSGHASPSNPAPPAFIASRDTQSAGPSSLANHLAPVSQPEMPTPLGRPGLLESMHPTSAAVVPSSPNVVGAMPMVSVPVVQSLPLRAPLLSTPAPAPTPTPTPTSTLTPPSTAATAWTLAPSSGQQPAPVSAPPPIVAQAPVRPSFTEAFAAMLPGTVDITPERGAVDLRKISPARAIPKPPPPPPPPAHPSRIWVELGVGRNPDRIAFDWRRMIKNDPALFKGKNPFVSSWVRTNRLLVGPFETDKAASVFTDRLHKADYPTAFVWTSPAGQVVDPLDGQ